MSDPAGPEAPGVTAASLVEAIRADSRNYMVTSQARLESLFPGVEAGPLLAGAGGDFPDLARIAGASTVYYYSTASMTESYATGLARVEEKDPLNLVAQTVRDESRIYPRPTAIKVFYEAPWHLGHSEMASALLKLGREAGVEDIQSCAASNGAVYLYSTKYLTPAHASGLTEYYEVERWNNP
jgi:hypothetical protein